MLSLLSTWFRPLLRNPGFALAAMLAIALGVAAVGTVFALIDATLLRPLAVPASERLLSVHRRGSDEADISLPDARHWRQALTGIDAFAVVSTPHALDWVRDDGPLHLSAGLTESALFRVLSAPPVLGRLLERADDVPGAAPVVVLSEPFWRRTFAADPAVLGRELELSGVRARIVGVASAGSDVWESGLDVWVPLPPFAPWAENSPGSNNFQVLARRAPGVSLAAAQAEMSAVSQRLIDAGAFGEHKRLQVTALKDSLTAGSARGLWLVLAFGGLVLLLAATNVAALLLVRAHGRSNELKVRHALGADFKALRQTVQAEARLLAVGGGVLGLLLALGAFSLVRALAADALPRLADARPGWATWVFVPVCAWLSTRLVALLAARTATRQVNQGPAQRSLSALPARLLNGFVLLEVALAVLLLTSSALLLRSLQSLATQPLGFDPAGVVTGELVLPESRYGSTEPQSRAIRGIVTALSQQAGVRHAAFVVGLPLGEGGRIGHSFVLEDGGVMRVEDAYNTQFRPFHGDLVAAAGLQLIAGRAPQAADLEPGERLAWVNQRFVATYLRGREAIGQRIAWTPGEAGDAARGPQWMRIVGVLGDTRSSSLRDADQPALYAPYLQREDTWIRAGHLLARVDGLPATVLPVLQRAVTAVDPGVALATSQPWTALVERALRPTRLQGLLTASFALIAAVLGLQGIAGVIAFVTTQRQRELGLRLALGAPAARLLRQLLGAGLRTIALGALLGAGGAWLLASSFDRLLHGIGPADPVTYGAVLAATMLAGLLALWWPARRILRIDPQQVLRAD